jgi:chemotaxis protein methyltransferase CheR
MFRDPALCRLLRDEYIPQIAKANSHFKVLFPMTVSGEELYSFLILVKESGLSDKCEITVSYNSEKSKAAITTGRIKHSKIEVSRENYTRIHGISKFEDYYKIRDNTVYFDDNLYKDITYIKQDLRFENMPKSVDLIFFRNQMLYFNQVLQDRILDVFYESLSFNGFLVGGIREKFLLTDAKKSLRVADTTENIYQKK